MSASAATQGGSETGKAPGWWERLKAFYGDVRSEMKKVTRPSFKEVRATTGVVLVTVAFFGLFFFVSDAILSRIMNAVLSYFTR